MAQTYTLEEAADRLGVTADEFKRRLRDDWKTVRSFRDGATLRFRAADIDELARTLGQASDPGVSLGDSSSPLSESSEELPLPRPPAGKKKADDPLFQLDDSDDIVLPTMGGKKADSEVRLGAGKAKPKVGPNLPTEELDIDLSPPQSGVGLHKAPSSAKLTGPKSAKIPGPSNTPAEDSSSEFELSLDPDSDSFELNLNTGGSSEEVPLGGSSGRSGASSGANLGAPADSGVSLEKRGKKPAKKDDDSDVEFELASDNQRSGGSGRLTRRPGPLTDSSSEFELTLDDDSESGLESLQTGESKGDIFETDFELPVVSDQESGSEVVPVESAEDSDLENSDFDLAIDGADAPAAEESESQVVLIEDEEPVVDDVEVEDEPKAKPAKRRPAALAGDDEDDVSSAMSRRGEDEEDEPARVVQAPPAQWGLLPALFVFPTLLLVFLGLLMGLETVRGVSGYQQANSPSTPFVSWVAETLRMVKKS